MQASVLDRQRRVRRERLDQRLVVVEKRVRALLVGEVNAPATWPRATIGTPRNELIDGAPPATSRESAVLADVGRAVRHARLEDRAEQAVLARQLAERRDQSSLIARGDELREAAVAAGHADRGVAGAGQLARGVDELLQDGLDGVLGRVARTASLKASEESIG